MTTQDLTALDWGVSGEERLYRSLRRYWHPVLYVDELGTGPQQVTLLDERIVVVRLGGDVRAFTDRCAHRGTAVSLGWVEDDVILRCPYHGWTYGPDGVCTSIPARFGTKIPPNARLRQHRAVERNGLIYVSLDPDPVFPIPDFPEFDDPAYHVARVPVYDWQTMEAESIFDAPAVSRATGRLPRQGGSSRRTAGPQRSPRAGGLY